jgi:PIN like domain
LGLIVEQFHACLRHEQASHKCEIMKRAFPQFFRPTEKQIDAMLKEALISYDANVLLNVYRYSEETQRGLELVFEGYEAQTILTHQAALEYSRNRALTILDQVKLCGETQSGFKKTVDKYIAPINSQPFLSEQAATALEGVMKELDDKRASLEAMISEDPYADLLERLFDKKIGAAPDDKGLEELHKQAAARYQKQTPPGYADEDKDVPQAYGDYIVWRQLMDIAKERNRDVVFVTDDSKEDWIQVIHGRKQGVRPDLREEFRKETGKDVWLFSTSSFLDAAKRVGAANVSDRAIKEVKAINAQDSLESSDKKSAAPSSDETHKSEFKVSRQSVEADGDEKDDSELKGEHRDGR